jgi:hypothetical protein
VVELHRPKGESEGARALFPTASFSDRMKILANRSMKHVLPGRSR